MYVLRQPLYLYNPYWRPVVNPSAAQPNQPMEDMTGPEMMGMEAVAAEGGNCCKSGYCCQKLQ